MAQILNRWVPKDNLNKRNHKMTYFFKLSTFVTEQPSLNPHNIYTSSTMTCNECLWQHKNQKKTTNTYVQAVFNWVPIRAKLNIAISQWELKVRIRKLPKARENAETKSRLILGLCLIGWERMARVLSGGKVKTKGIKIVLSSQVTRRLFLFLFSNWKV